MVIILVRHQGFTLPLPQAGQVFKEHDAQTGINTENGSACFNHIGSFRILNVPPSHNFSV